MRTFNDSLSKVANEIGFYVRSISKDVKEATEQMDAMKITEVDYKDGVVSIKSTRPGIVIGRKGELINGITSALQKMKDVKVSKVVIIEDKPAIDLHGDLYIFQ
jgi:ribosomal protein S3